VATNADFADFVTEQMSGAGSITKRKMMGEYVVYCQEKVLALICDNKLFIKPTDSGRAFLKGSQRKRHSERLLDKSHEAFSDKQWPIEAPPYKGSKNFFLIGDELEDRDLMTELIRVSYPELPMLKPKKPKKLK